MGTPAKQVATATAAAALGAPACTSRVAPSRSQGAPSPTIPPWAAMAAPADMAAEVSPSSRPAKQDLPRDRPSPPARRLPPAHLARPAPHSLAAVSAAVVLAEDSAAALVAAVGAVAEVVARFEPRRRTGAATAASVGSADAARAAACTSPAGA